MKKLIFILMLFLSFCFVSQTYSQTIEIDNGITWLINNQNQTGSWGNTSTSLNNEYFSTFSVLETLKRLEQDNTTAYQNAIQWLQAEELINTSYIAFRLSILSNAGFDLTTDTNTLLSYININNGWGGYIKYKSNNFHTALALQALKAVNYSDQTIIQSAIDYLLSTQNSDGGWGFYPSPCSGCNDGDESSVYMTALVSMTLQQFPRTTSIATAINKATDYLIAHQNTDGGFGSGSSTVYETSLSYLSLVGETTDATVLGNAINYLTNTQSADGSWLQDPYSTALALRALCLSENRLPPPPPPDKGTVTGKVVDASTNQPLAGVSVVSGQLSATTTNTGDFTLSDIPSGSQTITFSLNGYATASVNINITAGSITDLGTITLSTSPSTGIIKGTATDTSNGQPLEGVTITVTGSFNGSTTTGTDGSFIFTDVTPGNVTITASKTGYYSVTGTGTVVAGGTLFFNPQLNTQPPPATTGNLTGKVFDGVTNTPIQGAIVSLSGGPSTSTDIQGLFLIQDISPNIYQVTISASGYVSQSYQVMITAGVTTDLQIYLTPLSESTTVTGRVTDSQTGNPILNADVFVIGTSFSTKTDSTGAYTITGINLLEFNLRASAIGYNSEIINLTSTTYGTHTIDFALNPSQPSDLRIISLTTDKQSYTANEDVLISATIENQGSTEIQGFISVEVENTDGEVIAIVSPDEPNITILPSESIQTTTKWNTGQFSPRDYSITLKVIDPETIGYGNPSGTVLVERATGINILTASMLGGAIALNPPVTQANMQTPVSIKATIRNTGNIPITTTLKLEAIFEGTVIYTQETMIADLQINNVRDLDFGNFTPDVDGNYLITLKSIDPAITSDIAAILYSGPNATATFSVTPDRASPGDAKTTGKIHISGAIAASTTTQDPLAPLIKDAIQRAVNWEQPAVMAWHNGNRCYGCHKQAQALYGLEESRKRVTVDSNVTQILFSALTRWQQPDGSVTSGENSYMLTGLTETQLGLWAFTAWHDENESKPFILKSADFLLSKQQANGSWKCDHCVGWYGSDVFATAITIVGVSKAYILSEKPEYLLAITKGAEYLLTPNLVPNNNNLQTAQKIIGLTYALSFITDQTLKDQIKNEINVAISQLRTNQRADGGWGWFTYSSSDAMTTAHVLLALLNSGIDKGDQSLRKTIVYLLNTQAANGSWDSRLTNTTWVITSLPVAYERIGGIDADLYLTFPDNVILNSSSPLQTDSNAGNMHWKIPGIMQEGKDITLDLTLNSLPLGEVRKVALSAYLTFKNTFTNDMMTIPIDIPTVTCMATMSIDTVTDKEQYIANENIEITTTLTNNSTISKSPTIQVKIEDQSGNEVASVTTFTADNLEPTIFRGWAYRIPVEVTAHWDIKNKLAAINLDFSMILAGLGISGKTVDINSIRVAEIDQTGNLVAEKQAISDFKDANNATATWLMDGLTTINTTRYFYIYFDITDNDIKEPSENIKLPETGNLIAFSDETGNIYLVESNGDGTFGTSWLVEHISPFNNDSVRGIVLDDFNNDGFVDIVTGSSLTTELYFYQNKADGTNTFYPKKTIGTIAVYGYIQDMAVADFDSDGNKDFVVSANMFTQYETLYLFKGKGDGTFTKVILPLPSDRRTFYRGKAAADLNNDGKIDIVVGDAYGYIYLYKGNGDGTFMTPILIGNYGMDINGLITGDFDEDGKADIIVKKEYKETYLIGGNGDGTFRTPSTILSIDITSYAGFDAGDFNNDGHLDVIAATFGSKTIKCYLGKGDGTFTQIPTIAATQNYTYGISSSPALAEIHPVIGNPELIPSQTFNFIWNTGNTPYGSYKVHAILLENQGSISEDYATFEILPEKTIDSNVTTDKISYNANEPVTITSTIQSTSTNYIFENLNATITINM
ncbi:MAG: carboxypeptidase regulatory-like domain-containing protein, partial [Nitrospirota bacterium]